MTVEIQLQQSVTENTFNDGYFRVIYRLNCSNILDYNAEVLNLDTAQEREFIKARFAIGESFAVFRDYSTGQAFVKVNRRKISVSKVTVHSESLRNGRVVPFQKTIGYESVYTGRLLKPSDKVPSGIVIEGRRKEDNLPILFSVLFVANRAIGK